MSATRPPVVLFATRHPHPNAYRQHPPTRYVVWYSNTEWWAVKLSSALPPQPIEAFEYEFGSPVWGGTNESWWKINEVLDSTGRMRGSLDDREVVRNNRVAVNYVECLEILRKADANSYPFVSEAIAKVLYLAKL